MHTFNKNKSTLGRQSMGRACATTFNLSCVTLACSLVFCGAAVADSIAPPPYQVMNRHGVNMASGQVSPTLTDVTIGDERHGLAHTISSHSSDFVNYWYDSPAGPMGFRDKFFGGVQKSIHHKVQNQLGVFVYVMRAFDVGGSFDFAINANGTYTSYNEDPRHTLEFIPQVGFVWTKPDGTVVTYPSNQSSFDPYGSAGFFRFYMSEIKYPNGFAIKVMWGDIMGGATTNTGYQLKYIYVQNNTPVDNDDPTNTWIPAANSGTWSRYIPKYVVAINNAVDYCVPNNVDFRVSVADACPGLTRPWPTVTYTWPNGMPRAMFLGEGSFKVTDALGGVTEYVHRPFQKPPLANEPMYRIPRIVSIKSSNSTVPVINYDYITKMVVAGTGDFGPWYAPGPAGQVFSSSIDGDTMSYSVGEQWQYLGSSINASGGQRNIASVIGYSSVYGLAEINSWDMSARLESSVKNRLTSLYDVIKGVSTVPTYDARFNVDSITKNGQIVQTAGYPTTCSNRKTCNQATWIRDAKGNQTDYEYDPNSGQVTRVKSPSDVNGIRPEKRYSYAPKYAYYKNASGSFQQAATPIYLLVQGRTCSSGATLTDGSGCVAGASDEVVTDYDYGPAAGPNNLQLRGVTVTAYVGGAPQVRRTCYSYDDYGNRIGETTPNAGLASCN